MDDSAPASDLLLTKLQLPPVQAGVSDRPRLLDAMSLVVRRLTLISAPPGYGKTTLMAGWCRRLAMLGIGVAWVSLESTENDPALFCRYVVAALREAGVAISPRADAVLLSPGSDLREAVTSVVNDLASQEVQIVLALDDYHLIVEPQCHALTSLLLNRAPTGFHLAIATRSEPELGLGSLRAAGQLTEVREPDLRFTSDEAGEFIRRAGLGLADAELATLTARTEGWAAALRMAALWLQGEPDPAAAITEFAGDNRHVVDYLGEQVLAGLDPVLERFMLPTSILGRMCPALCEAVTREAGAAKVLSQIERANLFLVALDGRREWYRYHRLFREVLRAELARRDPAGVAELHARACAWHREHGTDAEAFHHATLAGDYVAAGEIVVGCWVAMFRGGRAATVRRWLYRFPPEHLRTAPQLGYIGAFVTGVSGAPEAEVARWLEIAERALADGTAPTGAVGDGGSSFAIEVDLARTALIIRDVAANAASAQRVADVETATGGPSRVGALASLGFLRLLEGDPGAARLAVSRALSDRDAPTRMTMRIHALAVQSLLELDLDDPEAARRSASRALELAGQAGLSESLIAGLAHTALGRVLQASGQIADSTTELAAGVACLRGRAPVAAHLYALLSLAEAHHLAGKSAAANREANEAQELLAGFTDAGILAVMHSRLRDRLKSERWRRRVSSGSDLSPSELAVLRLLAGQKSRSEIAAELVLSENTVKTHIGRIYRKLGVRSRIDAVAKARATDLL